MKYGCQIHVCSMGGITLVNGVCNHKQLQRCHHQGGVPLLNVSFIRGVLSARAS